MARPPKERRVEYIPEVKFFKPAGVPMRNISEINLTIEEIEAIRLKDQEGLTQQESAEKMEISRPTFQRVLTSARGKIAEALIEGKAIRFEGGDYRLAKRRYYCPDCDEYFTRPRAWGRRRRRRGRIIECPNCGNEDVDEKKE
ncbi:MAG: DUF134 domain-containing protein [Halanaerobiales bacterium]